MGNPQGAPFKMWMYYFIDKITSGIKMFNWSRMISDNLHEQLINLERTKTFYMSSNVVYLLKRTYRYTRLICQGVVGNGENEFKSYDFYPQLQLCKKAHFRRAHDSFLMYITRILQGGMHQRLTHEAKNLINKYRSWFIQFP